MADYTVTAPIPYNAVKPPRQMIAGVAITAGQVVYEDTTDAGKAKLAHAVTSALTASAIGIAMNSAPVNGYVTVATEGEIQVAGTALPVGVCLVLSGATAGAFADHADLVTASTWRATFLAVTTANNRFRLLPMVSGVINP